MKKVDLHCHSRYSEHPNEWFLQKLGAKESYTAPDVIYYEAMQKGMDYVTITDHNKIDGALILQEKHPTNVIVGVESTSYFPEDNCKVHILIYGLSDIQFEAINHFRKDIYELRDYLRQENLAHSVAHASYSVNGKLDIHHLEKLILLFDHFETINGGRNKISNNGWKNILTNLNEHRLEDIYRRYRIEPYSQNPWVKGFTGGSDDHGGLFLGQTYTQARANSLDEFLQAIRDKKTMAVGRHNDYQALAFTVYKIAYDFSREHNPSSKSPSVLSAITANIFEKRDFNLKHRFRMKTLRGLADWQGDDMKILVSDLIKILQTNRFSDIEDKLAVVYYQISKISDAYFCLLFNSLEEDLNSLNIIKLIRNISSSLPGIFLLLPFFSSLKHMHQTHNLVNSLRRNYRIKAEVRKRRTLWFSDTINDLNGVSVTLKQMGQIAFELGRELRIVSSLDDSKVTSDIPQNFMNLPSMYNFRLPFYEAQQLRIPSILSCLKMISDYEPDQIIISTPGPIGLLGLLSAKMLQIPCIGIYHTDFAGETLHLINDESASSLVLGYERWFYNQMDEIRAPTNEYLQIIMDRDISAPKMGLLKRGIEIEKFYPRSSRKSILNALNASREGVTLLYAGRVSQDKSLDILVNCYIDLVCTYPDLNLIIAGNGPYLSEMKNLLADYKQVVFTGAVPRNILPKIYNSADFFVFPSVTDTFGMVILEAQACGLPVIVSNHGGPKEIVIPDVTGFIVPDQNQKTWIETISNAIHLYYNDSDKYNSMRQKSRDAVIDCANWDDILDDLMGADECD